MNMMFLNENQALSQKWDYEVVKGTRDLQCENWDISSDCDLHS
jgi:hypothetical protein